MNNEQIIDINNILSNKQDDEIEVLTINEEITNNQNEIENNNEEEIKKMNEIIKDKKIEKIQIGLILFLIFFASLIYFFGYDFLKPFIRIDN